MPYVADRCCCRFLAVALIASVSLTSVSCSGPEQSPAASLEAAEILELINQGQKRNDPQNDIEVDLGKFRVTHSVGTQDEVLLLVDFQLYAVLSSQQQAVLEAALPSYSNRIRDAVISLVQSIDTEHLTDPGLAFLKAEMIAGINRVLHERLIKDVVFSNFSVHDAHSAPFPTTSGGAEKKKPSGGLGGHGGGHGH